MIMGGGGKRKPSQPLEDEFNVGLIDLGDVSADLEALAKKEASDNADSATEGEYDNVSSPGGSSTCSGPTYIRPVGFSQHAQEVLAPPSPLKHSASTPQLLPSGRHARHVLTSQASIPGPSYSQASTPGPSYSQASIPGPSYSQGSIPGLTSARDPAPSNTGKGSKKKKSLLCPDYQEISQDIRGVNILASRSPGKGLGTATSARNRHKKEPLPMKLRALPQSFWQQPNMANPLSPGAAFSTLPPLPLQPEGDQCHPPNVTDVAGAEAVGILEERRVERTVTAANTDLLFSLFNSVEEEEAQRRIHLVRRGRPKKPPPANFPRILRDDDPCMVSNMTESILPLIPERGCQQNSLSVNNNNNNNMHKPGGNQGTQVIKIMSISHGDRSVDLPSLNVEHNYPHLLSELVMKL